MIKESKLIGRGCAFGLLLRLHHLLLLLLPLTSCPIPVLHLSCTLHFVRISFFLSFPFRPLIFFACRTILLVAVGSIKQTPYLRLYEES